MSSSPSALNDDLYFPPSKICQGPGCKGRKPKDDSSERSWHLWSELLFGQGQSRFRTSQKLTTAGWEPSDTQESCGQRALGPPIHLAMAIIPH